MVTLATLAVRDIGAEGVMEKQLVRGRKREENKANAIPPQKCSSSCKLVFFCFSAAVIVLGLETLFMFFLTVLLKGIKPHESPYPTLPLFHSSKEQSTNVSCSSRRQNKYLLLFCKTSTPYSCNIYFVLKVCQFTWIKARWRVNIRNVISKPCEINNEI